MPAASNLYIKSGVRNQTYLEIINTSVRLQRPPPLSVSYIIRGVGGRRVKTRARGEIRARFEARPTGLKLGLGSLRSYE